MFLFVCEMDDMIAAVTLHPIAAQRGYYVVEYGGDDAEPMRYWDRAAGRLEPIEQTDDERATAIAAEADRRIDAIATLRRRERMNARGLEIMEKTASGVELTPREIEDRDTIKATFAAIEAIREAEDKAILTGDDPVWP